MSKKVQITNTMKLTAEQKNVLLAALRALDEKYNETINTVDSFKWLCNKHLPQMGEEYEKNINVFEIGDKTIEDLKTEKQFARTTILTILNNL